MSAKLFVFKFLLILIIHLNLNVLTVESSSSLRMINVLFRHGDRAPIQMYPNDPHINYTWHNGFGALSKEGSLQLYNLGITLRKRYINLIPSDGIFSNQNMKLLSSPVERCLMSAASYLAGFMSPPLKYDYSLPIQWQPIPIYPTDATDILLTHARPCPKYDRLQMEQLPKYKPDYDLCNYLTKYTGKNITSVMDVMLLYDTLKIEREHNLLIPDWTKTVLDTQMFDIADNIFVHATETQYMRKIKGGPILTQFMNNMENYKNGFNTKKIINLYSAHDSTVTYLTRALQCTDQTANKPDYGATIVFELHYNALLKNDYEIKIVYYYNSYTRNPKEIIIPNCKKPCALANFKKSVQDVLISDAEYNILCV